MSKFTPAPWRACHSGNCKCGLVFGDEGNVYVAQVYGPYHQGDGISGPDCVPTQEFQIANARLIAAAPLLYEALQRIVASGWLEDVPTSLQHEAQAALDAVEATNEQE